ncbi:LYR family of Fe/S cluster biogenesis protein [Striga asiatica]|uniref:LYR family of Fe/S cluster biogenesis protein n=1 Tax=Striga asiatica TaxID=4170 RepID=A0A5A7PWX5_STRAF|nr:LYR family of Fe/S cluster biogenesis protein [Striga asiatica]
MKIQIYASVVISTTIKVALYRGAFRLSCSPPVSSTGAIQQQKRKEDTKPVNKDGVDSTFFLPLWCTAELVGPLLESGDTSRLPFASAAKPLLKSIFIEQAKKIPTSVTKKSRYPEEACLKRLNKALKLMQTLDDGF